MRKICCILLLLLLCNVAQAKQITVPKGTDVNISVVRVATAKNIRKTYEVKSIIKDDVIINGVIVFCENDPAIIEIGELKKAKSFGRGGKITAVGGFAVDANGQSHRFILDKEFKGDNDIWLTRWIPFNKGHQAMILPSDIFVVKTNRAFVFAEEAPTTKNQQYINPVRPPKGNRTSGGGNNTNVQFGLMNQNHN